MASKAICLDPSVILPLAMVPSIRKTEGTRYGTPGLNIAIKQGRVNKRGRPKYLAIG